MNRSSLLQRQAGPRQPAARCLTVVVALALCTAIACGSAAQAGAQACAGDCNGDGVVAVPELIGIVQIFLGQKSLAACTVADTNRDGMITVAEIVSAVNLLLNGCPKNTITVEGTCRQPGGTGSSGFRACDAGTPVSAYRCSSKKDCLHDSARVLITSGEVADDGTFFLQIDPQLLSDPDRPVVYEALIAGSFATRALGVGGAGAFTRLRPYGSVTLMVDISPLSEAALRILDREGLENFSNDGIVHVVDTIERAAAGISYATFDPETAVEKAEQRADGDPEVAFVISQEKATPTPTATVVSTPTATASPTRTVTPTITPTLPPPRALAFVSYGTNMVAVVDLETRSVLDRLTVGDATRDVTASPDGRTVLVANEGADSVSVIDARRGTVVDTIPDSRPQLADQPKTALVAPDGSRAWVVNSGSNLVDVVDLTGALDGAPIGAPLASIPVGDEPLDIAVSQQGFALVTNHAGGSLSVIDTSTLRETHRLALQQPVARIALTPDDAYAYITTQGAVGGASTNEILAIEVGKAIDGTLQTGDVRVFTVGNDPSAIAILPGGGHLFVVSSGDEQITVIERGPGNPFGTPLHAVGLIGGSRPSDIALSSDGNVAYITNQGLTSVSIVNTADAIRSSEVDLTTIRDVGVSPIAIAIVDKPS